MRWGYKVIEIEIWKGFKAIKGYEIEEELNSAGDEGGELISITEIGTKIRAYFKKEK